MIGNTAASGTATSRNPPIQRGRKASDPLSQRARLLAAAERTFARKGYSAATMDDVALAAGMSKKTVYRLVPSKTELFRALLQGRLSDEAAIDGPPKPDGSQAEVRAALLAIVRYALSPGEIALQRMIVRETLVAPDLAEIFGREVINPSIERLADCLARQRLRPALRNVSQREVAELMLSTVFGSAHFKLMISDAHRPDDESLERRIDIALRLFCEDEEIL